MPLFSKTAEDYIKQSIRIAQMAVKYLDKGEHGRVIKFLELLAKIDKKAYQKILTETRSRELMEQCLLMRSLARQAIKESADGMNHEKLKEIIEMIIRAGGHYLNSEERFAGFVLREGRTGIDGQARMVSDLVEGITWAEAMVIIVVSFFYGLDVVIGGSSLRNNKIGGDLDLGFRPSSGHLTMADLKYVSQFSRPSFIGSGQKDKLDRCVENLVNILKKGAQPHKLAFSEKIKPAINRINRFAFKWYQRRFGRPLLRESFIYDGYKTSQPGGIREISDVREFFTRKGFRRELHSSLDKNGRPFGPSGYLMLKHDGSFVLATPKYTKGFAGEHVFWKH